MDVYNYEVNFHIKYSEEIKLNEYIYCLNLISKIINNANRNNGIISNYEISKLSPSIVKISEGSLNAKLKVLLASPLAVGVASSLIASGLYDAGGKLVGSIVNSNNEYRSVTTIKTNEPIIIDSKYGKIEINIPSEEEIVIEIKKQKE